MKIDRQSTNLRFQRYKFLVATISTGPWVINWWVVGMQHVEIDLSQCLLQNLFSSYNTIVSLETIKGQ